MLDIHTIGAGGGSIGWLDEGGLLRMGPQSAGADPGPACYGRAAPCPPPPTPTSCSGYLDPDYFAGGNEARRRRRAQGHRDAHRASRWA
jgi:N-methylhydantoinase A